MKKKICVVTGSRAEYGLFCPLLKEIKSDNRFVLQIVAAGMHLCPEFGLTYKDIEKDGFKINEKVRIPLSSDTEAAVTKSTGLGMIGFADTFSRLKPDLLILLGDRFEIFSAAIAAFIARIPIAHLYGGEVTEGVLDDAMRHSITKMSYLHFVSTEEYRKRVVQLGEDPRRVFKVGAIGIDNIKKLKMLSKDRLERELRFKFGRKNIIVTFHPVTLENNTTEIQFKNILKALDSFKDLNVIFTKPNADPNGRVIIRLIEDYLKKNPSKGVSFISMGHIRYLSAIKQVDAVLGNSSSGIIEAPSFGKPVINIGDRQRGRIKAGCIIDCNPDLASIRSAIEKAFAPRFKDYCKTVKNPYGDGKAAHRIYKVIKDKIYRIHNLKKSFYSIK
jgi:GDP/UDP-N,N'-diacetylbacillosamine 2-epimerase (hydrolysing)